MAVCRALGHYVAPCGTPQEIGFYVINTARAYNNTEKYDVTAYIYEIAREIKIWKELPANVQNLIFLRIGKRLASLAEYLGCLRDTKVPLERYLGTTTSYLRKCNNYVQKSSCVSSVHFLSLLKQVNIYYLYTGEYIFICCSSGSRNITDTKIKMQRESLSLFLQRNLNNLSQS
jgi:hypothetical protein